jgi:hypothetical protein
MPFPCFLKSSFGCRDAWNLITGATRTPKGARSLTKEELADVTAVRSELPISTDNNPMSKLGDVPHLPKPSDGTSN